MIMKQVLKAGYHYEQYRECLPSPFDFVRLQSNVLLQISSQAWLVGRWALDLSNWTLVHPYFNQIMSKYSYFINASLPCSHPLLWDCLVYARS